jgi:hypothetical protein
MSDATSAELFAGTCEHSGCTIADPGGVCALGLRPIDCTEFQPEGTETAEATVDNDSAAPTEIETEPTPTPVSVPVTSPTDGAPDTVHSPSRSARRESPVKAPAGPRRRIDLAGAVAEVASGYSLSTAEASEIVRSEPTTVVALVGPPDCGKTTMLAALYELFCKGPIGQWKFAGSRTFNALMRRAWYARVISGAASPDTTRTRFNIERPFIHLRIGDAPASSRSLLVADLSGEYFRDVASGSGLQDAVDIMHRADHVLHLVDSRHFVDPKDRIRAASITFQRVERLMDDKVFSTNARHTVIVTKFDLCPADYQADLVGFAERVASKLLPNAEVVRLVSRPSQGGTQLGFDEMLDALMRPVAVPSVNWDPPRPISPTIANLARTSARRMTKVELA